LRFLLYLGQKVLQRRKKQHLPRPIKGFLHNNWPSISTLRSTQQGYPNQHPSEGV
jgi:hypothetical protein